MNRILLVYCVILSVLFAACSTKTNCSNLPKQYSTYQDALKEIKSADFKIVEVLDTSKSSWIKGASFFSCDGNSGYLIIKTEGNEYLYAEMPYEIWVKFKNAKSFGAYYNENIKNKYIFNLY